MLFLIHAHSTRVWKQREADNSRLSVAAIEHGFQSPEGHSKLVMDGPWILLWPCFLMWPFFEAVIAYAWIHNALGMYKCAHNIIMLQLLLLMWCQVLEMLHALYLHVQNLMHFCVHISVCQIWFLACSADVAYTQLYDAITSVQAA